MKKTIAISLIFIVLFNTSAWSLIYRIQMDVLKKEVKKKIKSELKESDLDVFHFNKSEFLALKWKEKKEFYLGHNLYDLIEKKEVKGVITVKAFNDIKEKELIIKWMNLLKQKKKANEKSNLSSFFLMCSVPQRLYFLFSSSATFFVPISLPFLKVPLTVQSPPPRC